MDKWIGVVAGIVAPTTVITGLCYYFGAASQRAFFAYFSLNADALGFPTAYYVLNSVEVLYPALVILFAVACGAYWILTYGRRVLHRNRRSRLARRTGWTVIAAGAVLTALAVWAVLGLDYAVPSGAMVPVALGLGAVLIAAGTEVLVALRTEGSPRFATSAELFTLLFSGATLVLALFWLTNIYATSYGVDRAEHAAQDLWAKKSVVVLETVDPVVIPPNLVKKTEHDPQPGQRFRYRYECLRALAVTDDLWVLVPARWTIENGYALIVPIDEFSRINVARRAGLVGTPAADWNAENKKWQCPEVAHR
ncbi:hypothetical protein [Rhodococcus olei]|uniref:hypothetical protein n=1 Tax=Rhodococcus olei TaxID=2161675 RepID=UPI0031EC2614